MAKVFKSKAEALQKPEKVKAKTYFTKASGLLANVRGGITYQEKGEDGIIRTIVEAPMWAQFQGNTLSTDNKELQDAIEADPMFGRTFWLIGEKDEPKSSEPEYASGVASTADTASRKDPRQG